MDTNLRRSYTVGPGKMVYDTGEDYNFTISDVGFVIRREPDPTWRINGLKNDEFHLLAYALGGEAGYSWDGRAYTVKKGDVLFFPKGFVHSGASRPSNPWTFCYAGFEIEALPPTSFDAVARIQKHTTTLNSHQVSAAFTELAHAWSAKLPGHLIRCRSLILELLSLVINESHHLNAASRVPHYYVINNIVQSIQREYAASFRVEELSKRSGLSPAYFRRLFKQVTGYTPVNYVNRVKIDKAKDLLLSGECNVSEAAEAVGFDNVFYFSRLFKRISAVNPSEYIRR